MAPAETACGGEGAENENLSKGENFRALGSGLRVEYKNDSPPLKADELQSAA